MNKLKWYDFFGAIILLFSVTKSAIKPPELANHSNTLLPSSAPTTIAAASPKIAPREASLSQIDLLSASTSMNFVGNSNVSYFQDERSSALHGGVDNAGGNPTVKFLPVSAPRVETDKNQKGNTLVGLRSHTCSFFPVFIC